MKMKKKNEQMKKRMKKKKTTTTNKKETKKKRILYVSGGSATKRNRDEPWGLHIYRRSKPSLLSSLYAKLFFHDCISEGTVAPSTEQSRILGSIIAACLPPHRRFH